MNNPELSHMSWVSIETHRVKRPQVLWVNADAASITSTAFDAEDLYCCPVAGESLDTYASGTRTEWVAVVDAQLLMACNAKVWA